MFKSKRIFLLLFLIFINGCIFKEEKKTKFEIITTEKGMTSYDCPYIRITVKNTGNATGYNVACNVNAVNANSTIIDTGKAFFAGLGDIKPGETALDDAVFFDLKSHDDYVDLDYNLSWLTRD